MKDLVPKLVAIVFYLNGFASLFVFVIGGYTTSLGLGGSAGLRLSDVVSNFLFFPLSLLALYSVTPCAGGGSGCEFNIYGLTVLIVSPIWAILSIVAGYRIWKIARGGRNLGLAICSLSLVDTASGLAVVSGSLSNPVYLSEILPGTIFDVVVPVIIMAALLTLRPVPTDSTDYAR